MSITDPLVVRYNDRHGFWFVTRGKETFYDDQRRLYAFDSAADAAEWCAKNHPGVEVQYQDQVNQR
jgi:hypothetical protein